MAVGYGDWSGGAEEVGRSSCVVEGSSAVVVVMDDAARSRESIFGFEKWNSIMLRVRCRCELYGWASTWFHSPSRQVGVSGRGRVACKRAQVQGQKRLEMVKDEGVAHI